MSIAAIMDLVCGVLNAVNTGLRIGTAIDHFAEGETTNGVLSLVIACLFLCLSVVFIYLGVTI